MLKKNFFTRQTTKDVRSLISLITFRAEVEIRGVASPQVCRSGPTNFWFDHSTACNKMHCWGELKSLRAQSVGEVSAY